MRRTLAAATCFVVMIGFVSNVDAGTLPDYLENVLGNSHLAETIREAQSDAQDRINSIRQRYDLPPITLPTYEIPMPDNSRVEAVFVDIQAARERARNRVAEILDESGAHVDGYPIPYGPAHTRVQQVLERVRSIAQEHGVTLFDPFASTASNPDEGSVIIGVDPTPGGGNGDDGIHATTGDSEILSKNLGVEDGGAILPPGLSVGAGFSYTPIGGSVGSSGSASAFFDAGGLPAWFTDATGFSYTPVGAGGSVPQAYASASSVRQMRFAPTGTAVVPEPSTWMLLLAAAFGLSIARACRRR